MLITTPVQSNYCSLYPTETAVWAKVQQQQGLQKIIASIAAVVLLPFEWLVRLFYNAVLGAYSLCNRGGATAIVPTSPGLAPASSLTPLSSTATPFQVSVISASHQVSSLQDRQLGVICGNAIGDGLGVFTEFLTSDQAASARAVHGENVEFSDRSFFLTRECGPHLAQFPVNGWTDDMDQALMIPRTIKAASHFGQSSEILFARHLLNWNQHGLNEFSGVPQCSFTSRQDMASPDVNRRTIRGAGIGVLVSNVLRHPNFSTHPSQAALEVWKTMSYAPTPNERGLMHYRPAANGALMRTCLIPLIYRNDLQRVIQETIRYAKVTHADPRCIASCVAVTVAIALLMNGTPMPQVLQRAEQAAAAVLAGEMAQVQPHLDPREQASCTQLVDRYVQELRQFMQADLASLALGGGAIGYTNKCMGAAFYALRKAHALTLQGGQHGSLIFRQVLQDVIWEGGDADTNAAVAGALVGAFLGASGVPDSWKQGLHPRDQAVLVETNQIVSELSVSI